MPPKRQVGPGRVGAARQQSSISYLYHALSEPENFSVVKSLALFGIAVGFFSSSMSEVILPPYVFKLPNIIEISRYEQKDTFPYLTHENLVCKLRKMYPKTKRDEKYSTAPKFCDHEISKHGIVDGW